MSFVVSWLGILMLAASSPNTLPNELVSWLKLEDYFSSRKIDVSATKMLQLADTTPTDGKSSLQQLLALRWLGEHVAETKKLKDAHTVLEPIAAGKKNDAQGFAKEYAQRALALLDGKIVVARTLPENSVKVEGLSWFPEAAQVCGAIDVRSTDVQSVPDTRLRDLIQRMFFAQEQTREELYGFAEKVGNLRIDRFSFAYTADANNPQKGKLYFRITGLVDRQRLVKYITGVAPEAKALAEKGPKGEPISLFELDANDPSFALVGDEDLLIAAHSRGEGAKNIDVVRELLKVRADGKGSVVKGPLADLLQRVPAGASVAVVAQVPDELHKQLTSGVLAFKTFPRKLVLSRTAGQTQDIRWFGTLDSPEDAKEFVRTLTGLKQKGIDLLKEVPPEAKIKKETLMQLTKTLEDMKLEADGKAVGGGLQFAPEASKAMVDVLEAYLSLGKKAP